MEEPQNLQRVIFLVVPDTTTKDVYYWRLYHVGYVNYNTFIVLMPDYICTILLGGSADVSYEENTLIFDEVFKHIDSTQRFSTFEDVMDNSTDN